MRLFVAIDVGAGFRAHDPAPTHLTLRFLGDVEPDRLEGIAEAIARAAGTGHPYDLVLQGVGAFPSPARPRVVWVGATGGGPETAEIARRVATELETVGFEHERERFVPHVTLFRVRSAALQRRALDLLSGAEAPPPSRTVHVTEIVLKESTLSPRGASHRTLRAFPLGPPG